MKTRLPLKSPALMGLAALLAAAAGANASEVRVAWYGGNWGDAFKTCIADPYTKKTGVTVVPEIGTSNTTLAKLRQQQGKPVIDVAFLDGGISELAQADGLLAPLTQAAIPNIANLEPAAVYKAGGKDIFAVSAGFYSLGIAYNKKEITQAPASWDALWDPAYAGAVVVPSPANSAGVPFIAFLANIWKVPLTGLSPVYKKLHDLDVASYFDSSGAASNAFQSGEAVIGAHFNVGAWGLADKGLPIGFAVPKEGVWATDARLHLVKNSPQGGNGAQFINQALTPESSQCLADSLYLGPAVKGAKPSAAVAGKMPWGVGGSIADLNLLDWTEINKLRASITSDWNREVANK
ncbi:ABC transporter substrate-binding protein [Pollutimonas bauzanensis]|uniref:Putative spermidine/putrescine transport system substrate-binding protein n=1 Tax=Pollutimonas bauzanensis TaxID=658167 RepID=A0A1M5ZY28_9BURK|nr:ABC transporter substrate-binding protein [Pollutimonas bauzanensis]SHI28939.1 putative spermidine/putrescine transport system substrate-binding protein [Pollutimonas bauzanensis]